ncbi:Hypp273 [Branchiostoma lanceolatum]|uniref:Hypp273 protein n=1 Tax=Branchiostoma lanceolatum TaxID=7740 RepID=A0A8J9YMY9_BRALA|nr:Hypp273 [Branchiostoma lanceolatum]
MSVVEAQNGSHDNTTSEGDGAASVHLQADSTTEIEGASVSTAVPEKDEPAIGTVHIIIMVSAGLLGLAFTACLIVKLVNHRRLQNLRNLKRKTTDVLKHQNTMPFHNRAYAYASNSADAQTGPTPAMELSQLVPPIQNVFYSASNSPASVRNSKTHFNAPLPPIQNVFYSASNNPASMRNAKTQCKPQLPPIQNVSYHSNNSAALPKKAKGKSKTSAA